MSDDQYDILSPLEESLGTEVDTDSLRSASDQMSILRILAKHNGNPSGAITELSALSSDASKRQLDALIQSKNLPLMDGKEKLGMALAVILPIIAGAALGGKGGALAGLKAGSEGGMTGIKFAQYDQKQRADKLKLEAQAYGQVAKDAASAGMDMAREDRADRRYEERAKEKEELYQQHQKEKDAVHDANFKSELQARFENAIKLQDRATVNKLQDEAGTKTQETIASNNRTAALLQKMDDLVRSGKLKANESLAAGFARGIRAKFFTKDEVSQLQNELKMAAFEGIKERFSTVSNTDIEMNNDLSAGKFGLPASVVAERLLGQIKNSTYGQNSYYDAVSSAGYSPLYPKLEYPTYVQKILKERGPVSQFGAPSGGMDKKAMIEQVYRSMIESNGSK